MAVKTDDLLVNYTIRAGITPGPYNYLFHLL